MMRDRVRTTLGILAVLAAWGCGAPPAAPPEASPAAAPPAVDVVVAHFENATVEPNLSLAPEAAFRGGLERLGTVLPEARMKELAVGKGHEAGTPVHRELALEIAAELGASRVVVPRLSPITSGYTIDAAILDAATGEVLFEDTEITIDKRGLMVAVDKLTRAVSAELE